MTSTAGRYSLLLDLENAMGSRDVQQRATVLQRVTDLFLSAAKDAEEIALFDDVFLQLVQQVEASARAHIAFWQHRSAGARRSVAGVTGATTIGQDDPRPFDCCRAKIFS